MKIDVQTPGAIYWHLYDLLTGEEIKLVQEADSETGVIRRFKMSDDGKVIDVGGAAAVITEIRQFRVVDRRDQNEICRTGAAKSPFRC